MTRRMNRAMELAGVAILLTACGAQSGHSQTPVQAGDSDYAFGAISKFHASLAADEQSPNDLLEALPNHVLELGDTGRKATYSDAVVVGSVTQVTKGEGVIWGRDEDDHTIVSYDDPRAVTRTATVTLKVENAAGSLNAGTPSLSMRVVAPFNADPEKFIEGLAGLGRVVVLLVDDPSDVHKASLRPIMDGASIGTVCLGGMVSWPALGEDSKQFSAGLTSVDAVIKAAKAPETTTVVEVP